MNKKYENLEILTSRIQKQLSPNASVTHNARLRGAESEVERQVDVFVTDHIGQFEIRIVLECKDYKRPVDVKGIEEFHGLMTDVRAHKGALIAPGGFTKTAKKRAGKFDIDLYSPIDTAPSKWQVRATIPAICDFREAGIAVGLSMSSPLPLALSQDFVFSLEMEDGDGRNLGAPFHVAAKRWNDGEYPVEPGVHNGLAIAPSMEVFIDNGHGQKVPVEIYADIHVDRTLYFGYLPVERMKGFKDELNDTILTNAFSVGIVEPEEVEETWLKIQSETEAPTKPVITMQGRVGYNIG